MSVVEDDRRWEPSDTAFCPTCNDRTLIADIPGRAWNCRTPGCGFTCHIHDLPRVPVVFYGGPCDGHEGTLPVGQDVAMALDTTMDDGSSGWMCRDGALVRYLRTDVMDGDRLVYRYPGLREPQS